MGKKIMIFAGEASGDLQGARIARALKTFDSTLEFSGVGGRRMKEEGINTLFDSTTFGVIGAIEGLLKLPVLIDLYNKTRNALINTNPDLAILIDTPAFNMRLARICKEKNIKSVYYFPPSAWSGNVERAREIADTVDSVITTFRFTADTYDRGNVKHKYFGHPLIDVLQETIGTRKEVMEELSLKEGPRYIALLPGSRSQEIRLVMPVILDAAAMLHKKIPNLHFLLPIAAPSLKEKIEKAANKVKFPLTLFSGMAPKVMSVSDLVIMASGSASLEASALEVPMILTYKVRWLDWKIIKTFVKQKWCGLPNLILKKDVVPEILQNEATPEVICKWAEDLLLDEEKRGKMIKDLKEVSASLGTPGVTDKVAGYIWESILK